MFVVSSRLLVSQICLSLVQMTAEPATGRESLLGTQKVYLGSELTAWDINLADQLAGIISICMVLCPLHLKAEERN